MKIFLSRRYSFAALHRLHNRQLSEEENRRIYGKCSNPHGHGHNYTVELMLSGPVDARTGMVVPVAELDAFVQKELLDAFDFRNLNAEVPAFQDCVPTTENLCMEIFRRMKAYPGARLERVRVEETEKNTFEYTEEVSGSVL
jgi:6-pyruvoyltetrahydropterin/6-carboxytetrahydropterin synthase